MRAADRRMGLKIDFKIDLCQEEVAVFLALTENTKSDESKRDQKRRFRYE